MYNRANDNSEVGAINRAARKQQFIFIKVQDLLDVKDDSRRHRSGRDKVWTMFTGKVAKLADMSILGVTTKRRLRWVQPPRLGVRRASSAAPRVLVLLRSHSERGSEVRGRRNCITTNYDKLYTMYLMYYVCATRSETYPMPSLGSEWSEVRVPSPRWSRCRFQSNRNRSVTPVMTGHDWFSMILMIYHTL